MNICINLSNANPIRAISTNLTIAEITSNDQFVLIDVHIHMTLPPSENYIPHCFHLFGPLGCCLSNICNSCNMSRGSTGTKWIWHIHSPHAWKIRVYHHWHHGHRHHHHHQTITTVPKGIHPPPNRMFLYTLCKRPLTPPPLFLHNHVVDFSTWMLKSA